jgi:hypothetical protein
VGTQAALQALLFQLLEQRQGIPIVPLLEEHTQGLNLTVDEQQGVLAPCCDGQFVAEIAGKLVLAGQLRQTDVKMSDQPQGVALTIDILEGDVTIHHFHNASFIKKPG